MLNFQQRLVLGFCLKKLHEASRNPNFNWPRKTWINKNLFSPNNYCFRELLGGPYVWIYVTTHVLKIINKYFIFLLFATPYQSDNNGLWTEKWPRSENFGHMALFFLLAFILFNRIGIEAFYAIKQELIGVLRAVHHLGTIE